MSSAATTTLSSKGQVVMSRRRPNDACCSRAFEDALTWSCFDLLASLPSLDKAAALDEILEDAFGGSSPLSFRSRGINNKDIAIHIGKQYTGISTKEATEGKVEGRAGLDRARRARVPLRVPRSRATIATRSCSRGSGGIFSVECP